MKISERFSADPSRGTVAVGFTITGEQAIPFWPGLSLDELYRSNAQDVGRWVRRLGGPSVDVDDCVQEVFLVAQAKLRGFRGEARLSTWLYRICHNVVRHQRRKLKIKRWLAGSAQDAAGHVTEPSPTPSEAAEQEQRRERLYAVLDRMSDKYRTVFIHFELDGRSGAEIAELMGAKQATVWVWLHRAREDFTRRMKALEAGS